MEWVETTAKSMEEAKDLALDRLGVAADEAEFEVLEEPRPGLFGRLRGEARVRARVRPAAVRPKQDRRRRTKKARPRANEGRQQDDATPETTNRSDDVESAARGESTTEDATGSDGGTERRNDKRAGRSKRSRQQPKEQQKEQQMDDESSVTPREVGEAAEAFMSGLASAFGTTAATELEVDGTEIEVKVTGSELGLLVGPGGRTLAAVQDLARVASQRRLGDHDTRLRVDVAGYREKRRSALEKFALAVGEEVKTSGRSKALEPMASPDRKVVHDVIVGMDGVTSRSEGDDPRRRVVISPE